MSKANVILTIERPDVDVDLSPGSPEWCRRVSPSKAAPILGISPWDSQRSMWHKMRGDIPWDEENEAMERGTLCEPAVLAWWRKHHAHSSWREQVTLTIGDWCVATPDGLAEVPAADQGDHDFCNAAHPDSPAGRAVRTELEMVEAKTAAKMDDWGEPGTDQIPTYYLAQAYTAMEVCRRNGLNVARCNVPVLGGYRLSFSNYVVEYDAQIGADLLDRLASWHESLSAEIPPPLDNTLATFEAIKYLHPDIDPELTAECTPDEAHTYLAAGAAAKEALEVERGLKSWAIDRMGKARFLTANGVQVARRQPNKGGVSLVPLPKNEHLIALADMEHVS